MRAPVRSNGNYRCYGERDLKQLLEIRAYRDAGLRLADIRAIQNRSAGDAASVLQRRLMELDGEIRNLRDHQAAILKLLSHGSLRRERMITKQKWVSIMKGCGLSDEQMHRWHSEFERSAPEEHQEFLEFLHIPAPEIKTIRDQSRKKF
jgi:DNA-binding transcriptional MerR regulator